MSFKIPSLTLKYGLLVGDDEVSLISSKGGDLDLVAVFSNDEDGLERFSDFWEKNAAQFRDKGFQIMCNIIGEDYRVEKVAHLIGKYKTDFHNLRMSKLFRGSSLAMSITQGREERGRREDIVLFYGLLTENKVNPWIGMIVKYGGFVSGVHGVSFVNQPILAAVVDGWRTGNHLLMTLHEKGLLRQTQYSGGFVRFSRVSKVQDDDIQKLAGDIKKEVERTIQYLNSLKISIAGGLSIQFICPSNMVGQLRELVAGSEKIRFHFHDASAVAQSIGLKGALSSIGRDSSLSLHCLFSYIRFQQLAKVGVIRYYWSRMLAQVVVAVFGVYGVYTVLNSTGIFYDGWQLSRKNADVSEQLTTSNAEYRNSLQLDEDPPSSPNNVTAVSRAFRLLSSLEITPTRLIYLFTNRLKDIPEVEVKRVHWYLTNDAEGGEQSSGRFLVEGGDILQILDVTGEFLPIGRETYLDVADRADALVANFNDISGVIVQVIDVPDRELNRSGLSGDVSEADSIDQPKSRTFRLRIIWKSHDKELIDKISNQA